MLIAQALENWIPSNDKLKSSWIGNVKFQRVKTKSWYHSSLWFMYTKITRTANIQNQNLWNLFYSTETTSAVLNATFCLLEQEDETVVDLNYLQLKSYRNDYIQLLSDQLFSYFKVKHRPSRSTKLDSTCENDEDKSKY